MAKMNPNISFQELSKLAAEQIAKQKPVTLEQARMQALWLKNKELFIKKFSNSGSFEDGKKNAVEFLKNISDEEYEQLHSEFVYNRMKNVNKKHNQ